MFVEHYFPLVTRHIEEATDALKQDLPDAIRTGLENELRKLQAIFAILNGEMDKSVVHSLRAQLRWTRQRLKQSKDAATRKRLEAEIAQIENDIQREGKKKRRA